MSFAYAARPAELIARDFVNCAASVRQRSCADSFRSLSTDHFSGIDAHSSQEQRKPAIYSRRFRRGIAFAGSNPIRLIRSMNRGSSRRGWEPG
jgi:hypothetical protein